MSNKKEDFDALNQGENWINRTWRPAAAIVYLIICLFDFIIAPAFMGFKSTNIAQMAASLKGLDPTVAIALVQNRTPWIPLTMQGSGLFHVAFGAILGVAAWTRGTAQIEQIRQQGESDRSPYTPTTVTTFMPPLAYQGYPQTPVAPPAQPYAPPAPMMPSMDQTQPPVQVNINNQSDCPDNPDEPDRF